MITSHVYRPKPWPDRDAGCAYSGCGQPPDAHQRQVAGRPRSTGPGRVAPVGERGAGERDPGRDTPEGETGVGHG